MANSDIASPRDVSTTLNYYKPTGDGEPYQYILGDPPEGKARSNVGSEAYPVVIHDARGREDELTLDTAGFQFITWPSREKAFDDDEAIKARYYPEVEEILKTITGAKRIFIFDHIVRRSPHTENGKPGNEHRGPVEMVHVDQSYEATAARVKHHLPAESSRLLRSRVRLINVWRPLRHPVAHKPLAVSDWRSLDAARDLVQVRLLSPQREGRMFGVRHDPRHRWYYLSDQAPEEVVLIKCYDSEVDRARLTAHSAFVDPTSPPEAPHRQSIEVRALVFDAE